MSIAESPIAAGRPERREDEEHEAIEAGRRIARRSRALLRLLRIQTLETLRSIDAHAQQMFENQQRAATEQGRILLATLKERLKPKPLKETFVPLTGSNLTRAIQSKMNDVHDHHVGSDLFLAKLAIALNDIEGYVDSERELTFRGWSSVRTQAIFRALETGDLETPEERATYDAASEKMIEEARVFLSQELAWILDTYLRGRDSINNHGFLVRSEPDIRLFSNLLLALEFWDAHEVREGAPVRMLSSDRIQKLMQASWEQIQYELYLLSTTLVPEPHPEYTGVPLEEDEQRMLVMRPQEKIRHLLQLLRSTHWLSGSVEGESVSPIPQIALPEHVHHQIAEQVLAESFAIDRLVGAAASDVYAVHIAPDTKAPSSPGMLPEELQKVLLDKTFGHLEVLPLPALQSYCNSFALSGLLTSVVHGGYTDKKGKKAQFTFGQAVEERLRDYFANAGVARTRELIEGFSPEARRILNLDTFIHRYREEVPSEAQTVEGFVLAAKRAFTNIPIDDPRRTAFRNEQLPLIHRLITTTMSTQGAAPMFRFVYSLVELGLIKETEIKSFLTTRNRGAFKNFPSQAQSYLRQVAAVDISTAIQEFNLFVDSPLGPLISPATRMELARTLQDKLYRTLHEHGSYQALVFFGALEADLVRSPAPSLLKREVLREWLDAIEYDNQRQLSQTISRSDLD